MKLILGILVIMSANAFANGQVAEVTCQFNQSGIDRFVITSSRTFTQVQAPKDQGLMIYYKNGRSEFLKPKIKRNLFGELISNGTVPFKKGRAFFKSKRLGEIHARMTCHLSPRIPWERCQSQGTGEHGQYSQVSFNIGGTPVNFSGQKICQREVTDF